MVWKLMSFLQATFGAYDDFVHGSFDPFYDGFVEVEGYVNDLSDNGKLKFTSFSSSSRTALILFNG